MTAINSPPCVPGSGAIHSPATDLSSWAKADPLVTLKLVLTQKYCELSEGAAAATPVVAPVSLPQSVMEDLFAIADENGRSLSNLLAFMIETKLQDYKQGKA